MAELRPRAGPQPGSSDAPRSPQPAQRPTRAWEPAWHRRQRRERQQARLLVALGKAAKLLEGHHPAPARRADGAAGLSAEAPLQRAQRTESLERTELLQQGTAELKAEHERLEQALQESQRLLGEKQQEIQRLEQQLLARQDAQGRAAQRSPSAEQQLPDPLRETNGTKVGT